MKTFKLLLILFFVNNAFAKQDINIALLYPVNKKGVSYIGGEAVCISEGLIKEYKIDGYNLKVNIYDTEQSKNKIIVTAQKIVQDAPTLVVGTTFSDAAIVASKFLSPKKIPFIVPTSTNPKVTKGFDSTIRICYDDNVQADKLAKFTKSFIKPKKILVLTNLSSEFSRFLSRQYLDRIRNLYQSDNIKEFKFIEDSYDVSKVIKEIKRTSPDLLVTTLQASKSALLYNEIKKLSKKPTMLGSDSIGGRKSFFKIIKKTDDLIKFYFVRQWNKVFNGPHVKDYNKLHDKYCKGYEKTTMSVAAYDALRMSLDALKRTPQARKLQLIKEIKKEKYLGISGNVSFKKRNTPSKPVYIYSIKKNAVRYVQEI